MTGATLLLHTSGTEIYISLASEVSEQNNDVCVSMCQYQLASPLLDIIEKQNCSILSWLSKIFYRAEISEIDPKKYFFVPYSDQKDPFSSYIPTSASSFKGQLQCENKLIS